METLEIFDKMFNNYFDLYVKHGEHDAEQIVDALLELFGKEYLAELFGLFSKKGLILYTTDKLNYKLSKNRR